MPGAFDASAEFDYDILATAEEVQRSGEEVLRWLEALAADEAPRRVDLYLVREIHSRWFETTFPYDAGRERTEMVVNRKGTAVEVDAILPAVSSACENWTWRHENALPEDPSDHVEFAVAEANTLTVRVYDVHPFIDGNTRTTWHLRNYVHMLDGLRPLVDLSDEERYLEAWWDATPEDHLELDSIVINELAEQDR